MTESATVKQRNGMEWVQVGPETYQRWCPIVHKRVTVTFEGRGKDKTVNVRVDQPRAVIDAILDANVAQQNAFTRFGDAPLTQATRIPLALHRQIMEQCGYVPGKVGYDEKKFRQILNDPDHKNLRTIPGRI